MAQRELAFQTHIIQSYKARGGFGFKWNSEWQAGPPDLVVSLPNIGLHLLEVKHRPTWVEGRYYNNPLTPKQIQVMRAYKKAEGLVAGVAITASEKALGSMITFFDPTLEVILLDPYTTMFYDMEGRGTKFPVDKLAKRYFYG